jgi:hypothetical protein
MTETDRETVQFIFFFLFFEVKYLLGTTVFLKIFCSEILTEKSEVIGLLD